MTGQRGRESATLRRLRWRCRRGTKELDLLLEGFLDSGFQQLDAAGQEAFEHLLAQEDHDLQAWLITGEKPTEGALRRIVETIRTTDLSPRR